MTVRVYRFGLQSPVEGEPIVRAQLRAAREYRNDLVAIERGRRHALRAIDASSPEVLEAEAVVRAATRSSRTRAIAALREARKRAREASSGRLAEIAALEHEILLSARSNTRCFWGTYLDIESAHRQARSSPLYDRDAVTPNDPGFLHARSDGLFEGQVGIQIQSTKPITTAGVWQAEDTRVRLERAPAFASALDKHGRARSGKGRKAILALRVGSDGRDPIWARCPIWLHRAIPDAARWKWVRISVRLHGPHERWSCEITVDDPAPPARSLDDSLSGSIAVEWSWDALDQDRIRVANWCDTLGASGEVILPADVIRRMAKADSIRSVRDVLAEEARPKIADAIARSPDRVPPWLARVGSSLPLWHSLIRMHDLLRRWTEERVDAARPAYDLLVAWANRDNHLWEYETGARRGAIGMRNDIYRLLARQWSVRYRTALLSDQNLSREARWGDEGLARFRAGCADMRSAIENAFGPEDSVLSRWRDEPSENDERSWCERTRDAWNGGGSRGDGRFAKKKEKIDNAWAARKAKGASRQAGNVTARESPCTTT